MTGFAKEKSYCRADAAKVLPRKSQTPGTTGLRVTKISGADMLIGCVVRVEK